ncbi:hypothetical protein AB0L05_29660 [Nonomuraea pusilla]|uniref:hypothetical protein n=1 Tax=Nonomuraea pusilla TaxID=46177 RepID=UPI003320DBB8
MFATCRRAVSRNAYSLSLGLAALALGGAAMTPASVSASASAPVAGSVSAAPARAVAWPWPQPSDIAYLPSYLDLQVAPSGAWRDSRLEVTLPRAGTYALDLDVRSRLSGLTPVNSFIVARLWNVTDGTSVPDSERLLNQIIDLGGTGGRLIGQNTTVPISERITVKGPTTIRLQARRDNTAGASNTAGIISDLQGRTSFRYVRIS